MFGYVYVLSNKAFPSLLKIGYTTRTVQERIDELSGHSGVPLSYEAELIVESDNAPLLEKRLHRIFENRAYNKEFFRVSVRECVLTIKKELKNCPAAWREITGPASYEHLSNDERIDLENTQRQTEQLQRIEALAKKIEEATFRDAVAEHYLAFANDAANFERLLEDVKPFGKKAVESVMSSGVGTVVGAGIVLATPLVFLGGMTYTLTKSLLSGEETKEKRGPTRYDKWRNRMSDSQIEVGKQLVIRIAAIKKRNSRALEKIVSQYINEQRAQNLFSWVGGYGDDSSTYYWTEDAWGMYQALSKR